jgi:membrane protease subunit HflC
MRKLIIIFTLILIIFISTTAFYTIDEKEYAIVTQFGKPVRIIKEPGLYFKLPGFLQNINRFDKFVKNFTTQPIQLLLGDKNPVILTIYACWQVENPLTFFVSLATNQTAVQKLGDLLNSQLGSVLGDFTINDIINVQAEKVKLEEIENKIFENANKKVKENYGIKIVSLGIRRIVYPSIVARSVYARMRAEREKEAKKFRAEGKEEASKIRASTDKEVSELLANAYKQAEIIKGEGDKKAMEIYGNAYSKNPDFFEFSKSLETYSYILKDKTTLILSTDSDLFEFLTQFEENIEFGDKK